MLPAEGGEDAQDVPSNQDSKVEAVGNLSAQASGGGGINSVLSSLVGALLDLFEVFAIFYCNSSWLARSRARWFVPWGLCPGLLQHLGYD